MTTLRLTATFTGTGEPQDVQVQGVVATPEVAQEIAALFPKAVGVKPGRIRGSAQGTGYLSFRAALVKNGVNGGRNETGINRLHRLLAVAEKSGIEIQYEASFSNSYPSFQEFQEAIA